MSSATQNKPFSTRLSDDIRTALSEKAKAMGLTESDLARMFIAQKLNEPDVSIASVLTEMRALTALVIAALSETIDLDQARELLDQHMAANPKVTS